MLWIAYFFKRKMNLKSLFGILFFDLLLIIPLIIRSQNSFELLINSPWHEVMVRSAMDNFGNYYFVGEKTDPMTQERNSYLIKVNGNGNFENEIIYGNTDSLYFFNNLLIIQDTIYVFGLRGALGVGYDLLWMLKFDLDLNILNQKITKILPDYFLTSINVTVSSQDNIVLCGNAIPKDDSFYTDIYFYEVRRDFDSVRCSIEPLEGNQRVMDFFEVPGRQQYKLFGFHYPTPFSGYDHIILYDSAFNFINTDSLAWRLRGQLSTCIIDDSIYLAAGNKFFSSEEDMGIVKLNMRDELLLFASFGKQGDTVEHVAFKSISFSTKSKIFFGGCSNFINSQFPWQIDDNWICLVSLDSNLNFYWQRYYGGDAFYNPRGVIATQDGGCLIFGERYDENTQFEEYDVYILKVDSNGLFTSVYDIPSLAYDEIRFFPNPAGDHVTAQFPGAVHQKEKTLEIFNNQGILVRRLDVPENQDRMQVDVSFLPNGLYYGVMCSKGRRVAAGKLIIARWSD